jgi:hypothetical protein
MKAAGLRQRRRHSLRAQGSSRKRISRPATGPSTASARRSRKIEGYSRLSPLSTGIATRHPAATNVAIEGESNEPNYRWRCIGSRSRTGGSE